MITIHFDGMKEALALFDQIKKERIPTAMRNSMNDTAFGLKDHLQGLIKKTFPSANPSTVKNIFVKKATYQNMQAVIWFDQLYRRGMDEYMLPLIEGGGRTMKPAERRLGQYYVPGIGAKLNKYGNMSGGQVTQILSRLGKFGDVSGYDMNQTAASKRRLGAMQKRTGKKSTEYFVITHKTGGLAPGIYKRTATGGSVGRDTAKKLGAGSFQRGRERGGFFSVVRGRGVQPVMLFVKQPKYRPTLPFFTSGQSYINDNLPKFAAKEIKYQLSQGRGL